MVSVTLETQASPAQGLAPKSTRPEPSIGVGSFAAIIDSNATQAASIDRASAQASVKPSEPCSTSAADQGTIQGSSQGSGSAANECPDQADQTAAAPQTQDSSTAASTKSAVPSATKRTGKAATGEIAAPDSTDPASGLDPTDDDQVATTADAVSAPIAAVVVVPFSPVNIAVPVTAGQAPAPLAIAAAAIATSAAASAPVNFAPAQPADPSAPSSPTPSTAPVASGSLSANPAIIADASMTMPGERPDGAAVTPTTIDPRGSRIDVTPDQQQAAADAPVAVIGSSPSVIAEATSTASNAINDPDLTAAIAAVPVAPRPVLSKTSATATTIKTPAVDSGEAPGPAADEVPVTTGIISPVPAAGVVATAEPTTASADKTKLDSESTPARKTDAPTPASAPPHTTLATEAGNLAAVTTETTSLTSNLQPPSTSPTLAPAPTWNVSAAPIVVPLSGLAIEFAASIKSGKSSFQIRLDPAELGRIDVRIDVDRTGQVTSHLTVEKAETLAMLRQDAPQLQRALDGTGLKTGDNGLQFSLRDQSSQNSQGQNPGTDSARNLQRLVITEDDQIPALLAGQTYGRMLGSSSGVDIRV